MTDIAIRIATEETHKSAKYRAKSGSALLGTASEVAFFTGNDAKHATIVGLRNGIVKQIADGTTAGIAIGPEMEAKFNKLKEQLPIMGIDPFRWQAPFSNTAYQIKATSSVKVQKRLDPKGNFIDVYKKAVPERIVTKRCLEKVFEMGVTFEDSDMNSGNLSALAKLKYCGLDDAFVLFDDQKSEFANWFNRTMSKALFFELQENTNGDMKPSEAMNNPSMWPLTYVDVEQVVHELKGKVDLRVSARAPFAKILLRQMWVDCGSKPWVIDCSKTESGEPAGDPNKEVNDFFANLKLFEAQTGVEDGVKAKNIVKLYENRIGDPFEPGGVVDQLIDRPEWFPYGPFIETDPRRRGVFYNRQNIGSAITTPLEQRWVLVNPQCWVMASTSNFEPSACDPALKVYEYGIDPTTGWSTYTPDIPTTPQMQFEPYAATEMGESGIWILSGGSGYTGSENIKVTGFDANDFVPETSCDVVGNTITLMSASETSNIGKIVLKLTKGSVTSVGMYSSRQVGGELFVRQASSAPSPSSAPSQLFTYDINNPIRIELRHNDKNADKKAAIIMVQPTKLSSQAQPYWRNYMIRQSMAVAKTADGQLTFLDDTVPSPVPTTTGVTPFMYFTRQHVMAAVEFTKSGAVPTSGLAKKMLLMQDIAGARNLEDMTYPLSGMFGLPTAAGKQQFCWWMNGLDVMVAIGNTKPINYEKLVTYTSSLGNPSYAVSEKLKVYQQNKFLLFNTNRKNVLNWFSDAVIVGGITYGVRWDADEFSGETNTLEDQVARSKALKTGWALADKKTLRPSMNQVPMIFTLRSDRDSMQTQPQGSGFEISPVENFISVTYVPPNSSEDAVAQLSDGGRQFAFSPFVTDRIFNKLNQVNSSRAITAGLLERQQDDLAKLQFRVPRLDPLKYTLFKNSSMSRVEMPMLFVNAADRLAIEFGVKPYSAAGEYIIANIRRNTNPDTDTDFPTVTDAIWNVGAARVDKGGKAMWKTSQYIKMYDADTSDFVGYAQNAYSPFVVKEYDFYVTRDVNDTGCGFKTVPEWFLTTLSDSMTGAHITSDKLNMIQAYVDAPKYAIYGFRLNSEDAVLTPGQATVGRFANLKYDLEFQKFQKGYEANAKQNNSEALDLYTDNASVMSRIRNLAIISVRDVQYESTEQEKFDNKDTLYSNVTPSLFFSNVADFSNPAKMVPTVYMARAPSFFQYSAMAPTNRVVFTGFARWKHWNASGGRAMGAGSVTFMGRCMMLKWVMPKLGFEFYPKTDSDMMPSIKNDKARWKPFAFDDDVTIFDRSYKANELPAEYGDLELDWNRAQVRVQGDEVSFVDPFDDQDDGVRFVFKNMDESDSEAQFVSFFTEPECDILFLRSKTDSSLHVGELEDTHSGIARWRYRPRVSHFDQTQLITDLDPSGDELGVYDYETLANALIFKQDGTSFNFYRNVIPGAKAPFLPVVSRTRDEMVFEQGDFTTCVEASRLVTRDVNLQRPAQYIALHPVGQQDADMFGNPVYHPSSLVPTKETAIKLVKPGVASNEYLTNMFKRYARNEGERAAFRANVPTNFDLTFLTRLSDESKHAGFIQVNMQRPAFDYRDEILATRVQVLPTRQLKGYKSTETIEFTVMQEGDASVSAVVYPKEKSGLTDFYCVHAAMAQNDSVYEEKYGLKRDDWKSSVGQSLSASAAEKAADDSAYFTLYVYSYQQTDNFPAQNQDLPALDADIDPTAPDDKKWETFYQTDEDGTSETTIPVVQGVPEEQEKAYSNKSYRASTTKKHKFMNHLKITDLTEFRKYPKANDSFSVGNTYHQMQSLGFTDLLNNGVPVRRGLAGVRPGAMIEFFDGNQYCAGRGTITRITATGDVHGNETLFTRQKWTGWARVFGGDNDNIVVRRGRFLMVGTQVFEIDGAITDTQMKVVFNPATHTPMKGTFATGEWGVSLNAPVRQAYRDRFLPTVNFVESVEPVHFTKVSKCQLVVTGKVQDDTDTKLSALDWQQYVPEDTFVLLQVPESFDLQTFYGYGAFKAPQPILPPHPRGSVVRVKQDGVHEDLIVAGTADLPVIEFESEEVTMTKLLLQNRYGEISVCQNGGGLLPKCEFAEGLRKSSAPGGGEPQYHNLRVVHSRYLMLTAANGRKIRQLSNGECEVELSCDFVLSKDLRSGGNSPDAEAASEMASIGTWFAQGQGGGNMSAIANNEMSTWKYQCAATKIRLKNRFTHLPPKENIVFKITNPCNDQRVELQGGIVQFYNFSVLSERFASNAIWYTSDFERAPPPRPWMPNNQVHALNFSAGALRSNERPEDMMREKAFNFAYIPGLPMKRNAQHFLNDLVEYRGAQPATNYIQVQEIKPAVPDPQNRVILGRPKWVGPDEPVPWTSMNLIYYDGKFYSNQTPMDAFMQVNQAVFDIMSGSIGDFHTTEEYGKPRFYASNKMIDPTQKKPTAYQYSLVLPAATVTNMLLIAPTGTGKSIMTYLICKMYYDYRRENSLERMITFIVKDKTLEQMSKELFEQQSWADIAQDTLFEMLSVHHTNSKDETEEMCTLFGKWKYYTEDTSEKARRQKAGTVVNVKTGKPSGSVMNYYTDVVQLETIHVVSMSELAYLHKLSLKQRQDQWYKRNADAGKFTVEEHVQTILRMMLFEGYFCIDEVHELVQNWDANLWLRGLMDARRAYMRASDSGSRFVGLTATTASNKRELVEMLQLAAVSGKATPLFNSVNLDGPIDFTGGTLSDRKDKRPKLGIMRKISGTYNQWKLKPFIKGRVRTHVFDLRANFTIQPIMFTRSGGLKDFRKLKSNIRDQDIMDVCYDNPEFPYSGPDNNSLYMSKIETDILLDDLEPAFAQRTSDTAIPWSAEEKREMLDAVERCRPEWKMPAFVAHDRGTGRLEDVRLYKGYRNEAADGSKRMTVNGIEDDGSEVDKEIRFIKPQYRQEYAREHFRRQNELVRGSDPGALALYSETQKKILRECASDPKKHAHYVATGWYIDFASTPIPGALVNNPNRVYASIAYNSSRQNYYPGEDLPPALKLPPNPNKTRRMQESYPYCSKDPYRSTPYFQSELYVFVKKQTKNASDEYETRDIFVFKNKFKEPRVSFPRGDGAVGGGWQQGSVFNQNDVVERTYVKVEVDRIDGADWGVRLQKYLTPGLVANFPSITITKMVSKGVTEGQMVYSIRADANNAASMSLVDVEDGLPFIPLRNRPDPNDMAAFEGNILAQTEMLFSFEGQVVSVDEEIGGRVFLEVIGVNRKAMLSFANFAAEEKQGGMTNPFWTERTATSLVGRVKQSTLYTDKNPVAPPYFRPMSDFYASEPTTSLPLRIVTSAPYFLNWYDIRCKLRCHTTSADPNRIDDVSFVFDDMFDNPEVQKFKRNDFTRTTAHMLRYIEDVDKNYNGNDPEQKMVMAHYEAHKHMYIHLVADGEEDELFIDTSVMELIPPRGAPQTLSKPRQWSSQTRIRVDYVSRPGEFRFFYNDVGGTYLNEHAKDSSQQKIAAHLDGRLKSLTSSNEGLLATLSKMEFEGCGDFVGKTNLEEWDKSYFPNSQDRRKQRERFEKMNEFTKVLRNLSCVSYFSMSLMDNDQYAKVTYANNTDDPIVRRDYGLCEQTTKIIIMKLQNNLADQIRKLQFGLDRGVAGGELTLADQALRAQMKIEGTPVGDVHSIIQDCYHKIREEATPAASRDHYKVLAYLRRKVEVLRNRLETATRKKEKNKPLEYDEQILLQLEEQDQVTLLCDIYSQDVQGSNMPLGGFMTTFVRSFNNYLPSSATDDRACRPHNSRTNKMGNDILVMPMTNRSSGASMSTPIGRVQYPLFCWSQDNRELGSTTITTSGAAGMDEKNQAIRKLDHWRNPGSVLFTEDFLAGRSSSERTQWAALDDRLTEVPLDLRNALTNHLPSRPDEQLFLVSHSEDEFGIVQPGLHYPNMLTGTTKSGKVVRASRGVYASEADVKEHREDLYSTAANRIDLADVLTWGRMPSLNFPDNDIPFFPTKSEQSQWDEAIFSCRVENPKTWIQIMADCRTFASFYNSVDFQKFDDDLPDELLPPDLSKVSWLPINMDRDSLFAELKQALKAVKNASSSTTTEKKEKIDAFMDQVKKCRRERAKAVDALKKLYDRHENYKKDIKDVFDQLRVESNNTIREFVQNKTIMTERWDFHSKSEREKIINGRVNEILSNASHATNNRYMADLPDEVGHLYGWHDDQMQEGTKNTHFSKYDLFDVITKRYMIANRPTLFITDEDMPHIGAVNWQSQTDPIVAMLREGTPRYGAVSAMDSMQTRVLNNVLPLIRNTNAKFDFRELFPFFYDSTNERQFGYWFPAKAQVAENQRKLFKNLCGKSGDRTTVLKEIKKYVTVDPSTVVDTSISSDPKTLRFYMSKLYASVTALFDENLCSNIPDIYDKATASFNSAAPKGPKKNASAISLSLQFEEVEWSNGGPTIQKKRTENNTNGKPVPKPNVVPLNGGRSHGVGIRSSKKVLDICSKVRVSNDPNVEGYIANHRQLKNYPSERDEAIILYEYDWDNRFHNGNGRGGAYVDSDGKVRTEDTRTRLASKASVIGMKAFANREHVAQNMYIWTHRETEKYQHIPRWNLMRNCNYKDDLEKDNFLKDVLPKKTMSIPDKIRSGSSPTPDPSAEFADDLAQGRRTGELLPRDDDHKPNDEMVKRNTGAYRSTQAMADNAICKNQLVMLHCPETVTEDTPIYVIQESKLGDIREARYSAVSRIDILDPLQWSDGYDREALVGGFEEAHSASNLKNGAAFTYEEGGDEYYKSTNTVAAHLNNSKADGDDFESLKGYECLQKMPAFGALPPGAAAYQPYWSCGVPTDAISLSKAQGGRDTMFERMLPLLNPDGTFGLPYPRLSKDLQNLRRHARGMEWRRISKARDPDLWNIADSSPNNLSRFDLTEPIQHHYKKKGLTFSNQSLTQLRDALLKAQPTSRGTRLLSRQDFLEYNLEALRQPEVLSSKNRFQRIHFKKVFARSGKNSVELKYGKMIIKGAIASRDPKTDNITAIAVASVESPTRLPGPTAFDVTVYEDDGLSTPASTVPNGAVVEPLFFPGDDEYNPKCFGFLQSFEEFEHDRQNVNRSVTAVAAMTPAADHDYFVLEPAAKMRDQMLQVDAQMLYNPVAPSTPGVAGFAAEAMHGENGAKTLHTMWDDRPVIDDGKGNFVVNPRYCVWPTFNPEIRAWSEYATDERKGIVDNLWKYGMISKVYRNGRSTPFDSSRMYLIDSRGQYPDMSKPNAMIYGDKSSMLPPSKAQDMLHIPGVQFAEDLRKFKDEELQKEWNKLLPPPENYDKVIKGEIANVTLPLTPYVNVKQDPLPFESNTIDCASTVSGLARSNTSTSLFDYYFYGWPIDEPAIPGLTKVEDQAMRQLYKGQTVKSLHVWYMLHANPEMVENLPKLWDKLLNTNTNMADFVNFAKMWKTKQPGMFEAFAEAFKKRLEQDQTLRTTIAPWKATGETSLFRDVPGLTFGMVQYSKERLGGPNIFTKLNVSLQPAFNLTEFSEASIQRARLIEFEAKLSQMQLKSTGKGRVSGSEKSTPIFRLLLPSLYKEVNEILKVSGQALKTAVYVKTLEEAKALTEYIRNDMYVFTEKEVATNNPMIWLNAEGRMSVNQMTNVVDCRWPCPWYNDSIRHKLKAAFRTQNQSIVLQYYRDITDVNTLTTDTPMGGKTFNKDTLVGQVRRVLGQRGEFIVIEEENATADDAKYIRIANPIKPEYATPTFPQLNMIPEPFKEKTPWPSYPGKFADYYEPIFLGTSKEYDTKQPAFTKRMVGSRLKFQQVTPYFETLYANKAVKLIELNQVDVEEVLYEAKDKGIVFVQLTVGESNDVRQDPAQQTVQLLGANERNFMNDGNGRSGKYPRFLWSLKQNCRLPSLNGLTLDVQSGEKYFDAGHKTGVSNLEGEGAKTRLKPDTVLCLTNAVYDKERKVFVPAGDDAPPIYFSNMQGGNYTLDDDYIKKTAIEAAPSKGWNSTNGNAPRWRDPQAMFGSSGAVLQSEKYYMVVAVQEQIDGLVFLQKDGFAESDDSLVIFGNPPASVNKIKTTGKGLDRFNADVGDRLPWGCQTGLLVCDTDAMKSSLDFVGVKVLIKFGFMTYLESKQVDGRTRRLGVHSMYAKEDRSVTQYLIIPFHPQYRTCLQEYHKLVCRQTEFFQTLDDMLLQCSLSKRAVDAYGHEDKLQTKIKELKKNNLL